jgi:hypothetical protein
MKKQIEQAIEYLKQVSLKEPEKIRVEECERDRVVLSFEYSDSNYSWSTRAFKEFKFSTLMGDNYVESMTSFNDK